MTQWQPPNDPGIEERDAPGWYGKLSTLGDFAQRRLAPDLLQACDTWLSGALASCAGQLGVRWLDVYLRAPVLRFAWAPGVLDEQWWFGLLMPSCDNVGRYFPLLVAHPRPRAPADRIALDHLELWYEHLARAALQTLHEHASVDVFESQLREAPPWPTPAASGAPSVIGTAAALHYRLGHAAPLSQWLHLLAAQELQARLAGCTLWWRSGDEDDTASFSVLQGLPDGPALAELLAPTHTAIALKLSWRGRARASICCCMKSSHSSGLAARDSVPAMMTSSIDPHQPSLHSRKASPSSSSTACRSVFGSTSSGTPSAAISRFFMG